jgi:hypothetical protein
LLAKVAGDQAKAALAKATDDLKTALSATVVDQNAVDAAKKAKSDA